MPIRFRFSLIPFIVTVIVVGIGIALGQWQTRRALEKEAIERNMVMRAAAPVIDAGTDNQPVDAMEYRRIRAKGEFVRDWPIYLDNRPYQGRAGFYLLMPMRIAGTDKAVLVARGWIARNMADRARLPAIATPTGEVTIEGIVRRHPDRLFQLGAAALLQPGAIVQNAEIGEVAAASHLSLQPFLVEQTSPLPDGLVRDWPRPSFGAERHRGYAFQWYGLAATAFLFFVVTGFRRGTR